VLFRHRYGILPDGTRRKNYYSAELLQRPDNEQAFLVLPVGYPGADCEVPDIGWRPLDDATVWI
jgi:iodotyrosine deiodinase